MMASLKSEFRKMLSVRSTYGISAFVLAVLLLFAFYIGGIIAPPESFKNPNLLSSQVINAVSFVSFIFAFVGVLLVTHEYRYNTIMYTLTASKSRTRTLVAKVIAVSFYALVMTLLLGVLSPTLTYLGASIKGHELVPQTLDIGKLLWQCLFYGWGYSMMALAIAMIIRNQVGSLLMVFLIPNMGETLLTLLLKTKAIYLPFSALGEVIGGPTGDTGPFVIGSLSPIKGAVVFGIYLLVAWLIAWILFIRRDAN